MTKPLSKSQAGESTELAHNAAGPFGALASHLRQRLRRSEMFQAEAQSG